MILLPFEDDEDVEEFGDMVVCAKLGGLPTAAPYAIAGGYAYPGALPGAVNCAGPIGMGGMP